MFEQINDNLKTNESKEILDLMTQFAESSSPDVDAISNKIATFIDDMLYQTDVYRYQVIASYLFVDRQSLEKYKIIMSKPVKEINSLQTHVVKSGGKDTLELRRRAVQKTIKNDRQPYVDLILRVYVLARYIGRIADALVENKQIMLPSHDKISKQLLFISESMKFDNDLLFYNPWYNMNTGMYIFEKK